MFLKNRNIISNMKRSKVTDFTALRLHACFLKVIGGFIKVVVGYSKIVEGFLRVVL